MSIVQKLVNCIALILVTTLLIIIFDDDPTTVSWQEWLGFAVILAAAVWFLRIAVEVYRSEN